MAPDRTEELPLRIAEYLEANRFGKYRGIVARVGTGTELGLITALVPEVFGEEETGWARPAVPFAGAGHGLVALPEPGDGAWIEFEAGDVSKPIWSGFWWADGEIPDPAGDQTRVFATSNGHKLVLDESGNELRIEHGGGPSIVLTASDITLAVGGKKVVISNASVSINDGALEVS
jgi:Type VI secretion system/phage-baseplate injector OB domain